MRKTGIIGFAALLALLISHSITATELLLLQSPAVYDNPEVIPRNIFVKCTELPVKLTHSLAELMDKEHYAKLRGISEVNSDTQGKALELRILSVVGRGGGGATGAKYLSLRANLYQDGSLVAWNEFNWNRATSYRDAGTCKILDRAAEELASDVLQWMKHSQGRYVLNATLAKDVPATDNDVQTTARLDPDDTINISEITRLHLANTAMYGEAPTQARQLMETCGLDSKAGELMHSTFANRLRNVVDVDSSSSKGLMLRYKILTSDNSDASQDDSGTLTLQAELWRDDALIDTHSETFVPRKPAQKWRWIQSGNVEPKNACDALNVATKYLSAHTYRWYRSRFNSLTQKMD